VSAKDNEEGVPAGVTGANEGEADGPFTQTDLHFMKSLRISVEGEEENASESDTD
jgi:hypothetical protein